MRDASANYDTENTGNKKPVGLVELHDKDGVVTNGKYASQTFADIGTEGHQKYLSSISINVRQIDLFTDAFSGETTTDIELVDKNLHVTDKLANNSVLEIQPKIGFQGLDEADFYSLPKQRIARSRLVNDIGWNFLSRDNRQFFTNKLFRNVSIKTRLNGAITDSATSITVDSTAGWIDPTTSTNNTVAKYTTLFKIDEEIIAISSLTGTVFTTSALNRPFFGTTAQAHDDEAIVSQILLFGGNWAGALLALLMTTEDGSGHEYYDAAAHDADYGGMGLGLTGDQVDFEEIEKLGYKLNPIVGSVNVAIDEPQDAFSFINNTILVPNGLVLYTNSAGKISVQSFDYIHLNETFSAATTFNNNSILSADVEVEDTRIINYIEYKHSPHSYESDQGSIELELDAGVTEYGKNARPLVIDLSLSAVDITDTTFYKDRDKKWHATKWLYTFANAPGIVRFRTTFENWLVEVGDFVNLTWKNFTDLTDGTRGWTDKKAIILGQTAVFDFVNSGRSYFEYTALTWEMYDKISSFYTITTVNQGDIDDTTLAVDATTTLNDPPDANDAYEDFGATVNPDLIWCTLTIDPPGAASGEEYEVTIVLTAAENVGGTYTDRGNRSTTVRYNSGDDTAFDIDIMWALNDADNDVDRIYAQWTAQTSSAGDHLTSVTLKTVRHITLDKTITIT